MVPAPLQTLTLLGYAGFGGGSVARHLPRTVVRGEYHLVAMRAQVAADVFDNAVRYVAENQQGRLFGIVEDEAQVVLGSAGGFDQPYKFGRHAQSGGIARLGASSGSGSCGSSSPSSASSPGCPVSPKPASVS